VSLTRAQNAENMDMWRKMTENMIYVQFYSYEWMSGATPNAVIARELADYISQDLKDLATGITTNEGEWGVEEIRWENRRVQPRGIYYGSEQFSYVSQYEIDIGRDITALDVERANNVAVIGSIMRDRIFSFRDPIGETIYIKNVPFEVIGVYRQRDKYNPEQWSSEEQFYEHSSDNVLVVPHTASRALNPDLNIQSYMIRVEEPSAALELMELLNDFFSGFITQIDWANWDWDSGIYPDWSSETGNYHVYAPSQWYEQEAEMEEQQTRFVALIAAISLFVGGIGIMNIMLVTVTERTREIGVRKAIGAPRRTIVAQFLIEAAVLSGAGGFLGVLAGFVITLYWGQWQYGIIAQPDLVITAIAFLGSLAMGIIFGIYPAIKASSLQPVDALRTE